MNNTYNKNFKIIISYLLWPILISVTIASYVVIWFGISQMNTEDPLSLLLHKPTSRFKDIFQAFSYISFLSIFIYIIINRFGAPLNKKRVRNILALLIAISSFLFLSYAVYSGWEYYTCCKYQKTDGINELRLD